VSEDLESKGRNCQGKKSPWRRGRQGKGMNRNLEAELGGPESRMNNPVRGWMDGPEICGRSRIRASESKTRALSGVENS
jgi:hypothetical protein